MAGALETTPPARLGRRDDRDRFAGGGEVIVVAEQHGLEALPHVPFDMAGEEAQKDTGSHPRGEVSGELAGSAAR